MSEPEAAPGAGQINDLLERLRSRVAERRASGEYPDDLEEKLEEHFRRIVFHRTKADLTRLQYDVQAIDSHMDFAPKPASIESGMPGGAVLHKALNKALARQNQQLSQQISEFAVAIRRVIITLADAVQDPDMHTHGDLVGHLDAVLEKLASFERGPEDSGLALGDLQRRVEQLEQAEAARDFKPWFTNIAFEDHFRNNKEGAFEALYGDLADEISAFSPVLDIGCGRGEFIELVQARGGQAWGVEMDTGIAEFARTQGLDVRDGDGLKILAAQPDGSLGGIVLMQVIEHLTIQQQLDLVALAYDKLRDGGRIIVETVNPQSLYVYAHAFYIDPTHTRPVHPAYLAFLFEQIGFKEVRWDWRNSPPEHDVLEPEGEGDSAANRNVQRLNTLLFAEGDYALIVTK